MRVLAINSVPYGSTCKIMLGVRELCLNAGIEYVTSTGFSTHPVKELPTDNILIGSKIDKVGHIILSKITGKNGCFSRIATKRFLKRIDEYNPDIIHLHNLHGWYINHKMLFDYIKRKGIKVVWTLHDCWSFTGQCPHFTMVGCDKWKTGCYSCEQYKDYPGAYVDKTKKMWHLKSQWFAGVKDLTIVTPSRWLADLVKQSFLKDYPVQVINNGIDLSVFKPTVSDFRKKYNCEDKYILLGVAFGWGVRKGLDVFIELAKRLPDEYKIVLVGTDAQIDQQLPDNIISIHRTQNQRELAEIYTAADLFVNPTREENYPTVNMEAIACGTPVLTFNTGGSAEMLDSNVGVVVPSADIEAMMFEMQRICSQSIFAEAKCLEKAEDFNHREKMKTYLGLYSNLVCGGEHS